MSRRSTKVACVCETCGTQFMIQPCYIAVGGGRYCSTKCTGEARKKRVDCLCKRCGKPFTVSVSEKALGNGVYCSRECQHGERLMFICQNCGKQFTRVPSKGGAKVKYCSPKCHGEARLNALNLQKICEYCGVAFRVTPSIQERRKYCSLKCRHLAERRRIEFKCDHCGELFTDLACKIKSGRRFCSNACFSAASDKRIVSKCQFCGKSFRASLLSVNKGQSLYCSRDCANQAKSGSANPRWRGGGRVDRGPNWRRQRRLAYSRDGGVCQICRHKPRIGEPKNHVHHIKPYREFNGDYLAGNDLLNLITLCSKCHPRVERGALYVPKRLF